MFQRTARICLEIIAVLVLVVIAATGLAAWRLSQGPVSLAQLTPYIDDALEGELPGLDLRIGETVVAWEGLSGGFGLRLRDVEVRTKAGVRVAAVPDGSVSLSVTHLLRGRIVPLEVEIDNLRLALERQPDGEIRLRGAGDAEVDQAVPASDLPNLYDWLKGAPTEQRLRRVVIRNASIELADPTVGAMWRLDHVNLALLVGHDGAELTSDLDVTRRDATLKLSVGAHANTANRSIAVTVVFDQLRAALFADVSPAAAPLAGLDAPLGGRIELGLDATLRVTSVRADLKVGAGTLTESSLYPEPVALAGGELRAVYDRDANSAEIERLTLDLNGPTLQLAARGENLRTAPRVQGRVVGRRVAVDSFATLWPPGAARNARRWIVANLSHGHADEADFEFTLHADAPDWSGLDVGQLKGDVQITGVTVNYLNPMPKVVGVNGRLTMNLERVDIMPNSGTIGALVLQEGKIAITGLNEPDQQADIQLTVKGPVRDVMQLIDSRPLGYAKAVGLDPAAFSGEATTRLRLGFPLIDRLKMENLKVSGQVDATGFGLKNAALGQDARDGQLAATFDDKALRAAGRLTFGRTPLEIDLTQAFLSSAPEQQRVKASGRLPPGELAALGFDPKPFLDGPLPVTVDILSRRGGRTDIAIDAGLDDATMAIPELGWSKQAGIAGSGRLELTLLREKLTEIRIPRVAAGDLDAVARVSFAADGKTVSRIDLTRLKAGRTDIAGTVTRQGTGWNAQLAGRSLDAEALLSDTNSTPASPNRPRIAIGLRADEVHTTADRSLTDVVFQGDRGARWDTLRISAKGPVRDGSRAPFEVDLSTGRDGMQTLTASSPNAGAMLRGLGITENIIGGEMKIQGATDPTRADRALRIDGQIREYRMVQVPAIARFLSIALLTGLADSMRGEGIGFRTFDLKAWLTETGLEIDDMAASGPALGVTMKGKLDFVRDEIDAEGVIIPANSVNSLLGRIPVVGDVLFGPGLFAATYKVKGPQKNPEVQISALSAIAPGVLRRLFTTGPAPEGLAPKETVTPGQ